MTTNALAELSFQANTVSQSFNSYFESSEFVEFGVGYEPMPNVSVNVMYSNTSAQILNEKKHRFASPFATAERVDADISQYYFDTRYGTKWCFKFCVKPYALMGIGLAEIKGAQLDSLVERKGGDSGDYVQYHAGSGVRYDINANWSVQTELRYIAWSMGDGVDKSGDKVDSLKTSIGLHYRVGLPKLSLKSLKSIAPVDDTETSDIHQEIAIQEPAKLNVQDQYSQSGNNNPSWLEYPSYQSEQKSTGYYANQILVIWKTGHTFSANKTLEKKFPISLSDGAELSNLGYSMSVFTVKEDVDIEQLEKDISAANADWIVSRNSLLFLQSDLVDTADSRYTRRKPRLFAQEMIAHTQWTETHNPDVFSDVRIGVIDTAINPKIIQQLRMSGQSAVSKSVLRSSDIPASTEHGTAIAQLILGPLNETGFMGIAPKSDLFWVNAMRSVDGDVRTNSAYIAMALDYLVGRGVDVINMSLGGEGDRVMKKMIEEVLARNITLIAAVGNKDDGKKVYPGAYNGVWAVSAVDAAGERFNGAPKADYTAFSAPGVQVWAPLPDDTGGRYFTGTSFAAAIATARIAWQPSSFWSDPPDKRLNVVCADAKRLPAPATGCGLVQFK